tara:strand:- start:140 stop:394 length:255 start_codon:yes stop_codon:yes gene_type:complete
MTNNIKELLFIATMAQIWDCSQDKIINSFNKGWIYIFDHKGIHKFYSEIIDFSAHSFETINEIENDIKLKKIIKLDDNTFAMWA